MSSLSSSPLLELPEPFASIPRIPLTFPHPTPIEPLANLTRHLCGEDGAARVFVKREDCNSGLAGGGNKVRKLEYVLADAVAKGADTLVTEGGVQSNHMRQTAAAGSKLGLKTVLLPRDVVPDRKPDYYDLGNVQITGILSATREPTAAPASSPTENRVAVLAELEKQGRVPYWIPSGASTHPLGGLGYARFAWEVARQEQEMGLRFDVVVTAVMSGSTLGGMVAGFKQLEMMSDAGERKKRRLIGVAVGKKPEGELEELVFEIAQSAADRIGLEETEQTVGEYAESTGRRVFIGDEFEIDHRWSAGQYGRLDERTTAAIKLVAGMEGMVTDPVYSGKAATGLVEMLRAGELHGNVLFVHTGGLPSISAYPELR